MNLWDELHHLFQDEHENGTLPDIFVENISNEEVVKMYQWVMSLTAPYGNPTLWSLEEERDIELSEFPDPASYFVQGKSEGFRHGLEEFEFNGVKIPQLAIGIDSSGLEFDYRMGQEWGAKELEALFEFLYQLRNLAQDAKITQANEGGYKDRNAVFSSIFESYVVNREVS